MTNNSPLGSEVSRLIDTTALEPHRRAPEEFASGRDWGTIAMTFGMD